MPLTFSEISWPCKVWSVWCTFYGNGIFKMKPTHWLMLLSKYSWPHWFKAHPPPMVNARLSTLGWISKVNSYVFVHTSVEKTVIALIISNLCFPENNFHILFFHKKPTVLRMLSRKCVMRSVQTIWQHSAQSEWLSREIRAKINRKPRQKNIQQ